MSRLAFAASFSVLVLTSTHAAPMASLAPDTPGTYSVSTPEVSAIVTMRQGGDEMYEADVIVQAQGIVVASLTYDDMWSPAFAPSVHIVEMDANNETPEVFLSQYTGGAHCCTQVQVVTKTPSGWQTLDMGNYDGDVIEPEDVDGDGVAEISTYDNRFLYQFASYAGSFAPPIIFGLRNGTVENVTSEEGFRWTIERAEREMGQLPDSGAERNSWLATHAAIQSLLGKPDPLAYAVQAHDPSANWGRERCIVELVDYSCPEGKTEIISFEQALTDFLTDANYLREAQ